MLVVGPCPSSDRSRTIVERFLGPQQNWSISWVCILVPSDTRLMWYVLYSPCPATYEHGPTQLKPYMRPLVTIPVTSFFQDRLIM